MGARDLPDWVSANCGDRGMTLLRCSIMAIYMEEVPSVDAQCVLEETFLRYAVPGYGTVRRGQV